MKKQSDKAEASPGRGVKLFGLLALSAIVLLLISLFMPRSGKAPEPIGEGNSRENSERNEAPASKLGYRPTPLEDRVRAQEIVSAKVGQFARGRKDILVAMASKFQVEVDPGVARFFAAVEAGNWQDITNSFAGLKTLRNSSEGEGLRTLWGPIQETFGVAEVAHKWEPEKLLSYGQTILDALRPGMVYVGGTDPGRFIPTLLNETSDGERHIILTQNALADGTYIRYLDFLYADRMKPISPEDSQRTFSDYLAKAQQRLKDGQLRPGEDVRLTDGRMQVSGQVAVMMINEQLFGLLTDKNPELSFAMEESFAFNSVYSNAVPLGPIIELRATNTQEPLEESGEQAIEYWRNQAQQFRPGQATSEDAEPRKAWAKMASAQAGLLGNRGAADQAAAIHDVALEISPSSPEVVIRYTNFLLGQNRFNDARTVVERGLAEVPDNEQLKELAKKLREGSARPSQQL